MQSHRASLQRGRESWLDAETDPDSSFHKFTWAVRGKSKPLPKSGLNLRMLAICMSWLICRQIFQKKALHGKICCPSFVRRRETTTEKRRCVGRNKSGGGGGKSVAANCLVVKWHCVSSIRRRRDCRETRKSEGNLSFPST